MRDLKVRGTITDSNNPYRSFKRDGRDQSIVSDSFTTSSTTTSVPAFRGKTARWIANREWRLGEKIGSGSFGEVFKGMNDKVWSLVAYL